MNVNIRIRRVSELNLIARPSISRDRCHVVVVLTLLLSFNDDVIAFNMAARR